MTEAINIGTVFMTRGNHPRKCTVTDIHKTYNAAGALIKIMYVATHDLAGQTITEYDIPAATIIRGRITRA